MSDVYKTPLAKAARIMEIIIPAYMFGKAWGIALDERAVALFRAEFPAFLIDTAHVDNGVRVRRTAAQENNKRNRCDCFQTHF